MTAASKGPATVRALVADHAARLREAGVASPEVDARRIVEHVLGEPVGWDRVPGGDERDRIDALIRERERRVPLQHLVGATWFRLLRLRCEPGVFVPRPESEVVAGVAIAAARERGPAPLVVDVCTGTGAIALSIMAEVPGAQVWATERSAAAVRLARRNLRDLVMGAAEVAGPALGASCAILEGDLLAPLDPDLRGRVDVLVANPPYLPLADRGSLPPEVADHDPAAALFGGADGHEVVDRLLKQASVWLAPGGTVVIEIDDRRGGDARAAATRAGLVDVRVVRDLTGADRALVARRAGTPTGREDPKS